MTTINYNDIQNNQKITMEAGLLNLNDNNFYCIVRESYNNMLNHKNVEIINQLPKQSNIMFIQQIYLDLINSKEPLIIGGVKINFEDNIWNFTSQYKAGKILSNYTYNFNSVEKLSDYQVILMKLFTIYFITEYGINNGTNSKRLDEVKKLMEYMTKMKKSLIEDLTLKDYKNFYEIQNIKYNTMIKRRRVLKEFLTFYSIIAKDVYTKELNNWFNDIDTSVIKADIEQNKTPLLPSDFYKKYTDELYKIVSDINQDKWDRGYAGILYIGTQTGLRTSELTILRVQDLEVQSYRNKKIGILNYRSTKTGDGKNKIYDNGRTNANEKVIAVYEILKSLFQEEREIMNVDFLVPRNLNVKSNGRDKNIRKEMSFRELDKMNKKICVKNCREWKLLNTEDSELFCGRVIYNNKKENKFYKKFLKDTGVKDGDVVSCPTVRQFRVYVASELRERGVDDRTTAYLLNHHCVEMYGYYARPKHSIQEDIDFSREIVADVIRDGTKILGPKGDALTEKINEIIKENNFNVEKDIDAIIEKVCNEVPIRAKSGGFCIKSNPRRECRHDAKTDEFMCAYGCCPNHCHMYFMLPITYEKVCTLHKTYEYNLQAGFKNAAEKEGYKLIFAIDNELIPEISETRNELTKRSIDDIIKAHPEMEKVIHKIDEIEKEVIEWKKIIETK